MSGPQIPPGFKNIGALDAQKGSTLRTGEVARRRRNGYHRTLGCKTTFVDT